MLDGGVETMMRPSEGVVGLDPLAARLADGDPRAARDLVEGHYARLYRYAFAMLRGEQDAEDAVQDAFERALTTLGRYPEERIRAKMLRAWMYRITLNMVRNRLRRNREAPVGGDPGTLSGMPGTGIGERREDVIDVLATLGRLPERQRVALALCHLQDLPYAEICAATGWPEGPEGTAETLVRRGLARLRNLLAVEDPEGGVPRHLSQRAEDTPRKPPPFSQCERGDGCRVPALQGVPSGSDGLRSVLDIGLGAPCQGRGVQDGSA